MIRDQSALIESLNVGSITRCGLLVCLAVLAGAAVLTISQALGGIAISILGVATIGFVNGANDLPKSVYTLIGCRALGYRAALTLGVVATFLGGVTAIFWLGELLALFSTGGITVITVDEFPFFPLAVIGGSVGWILLATKTGLPVSTTHALVGASVGGGLMAVGIDGIRWQLLAFAVVAPLLAGPLVAGLLGFAISKLIVPQKTGSEHSLARYFHLASSVGASFVRALNDAPKIVGVGLLAVSLEGPYASPLGNAPLILLAVLSMVAGGLWASRPVVRTLAFRVVSLNMRNGLAANATNTLLVGSASFLGLPLSTTHVSGAALVGASQGDNFGVIRWKVVRDIVNGWLVTVPAAAILAAGFSGLAASLGGLM